MRGWVLAACVGLLTVIVPPDGVTAATCDPSLANPIPCENSQAGTPPSVWDVNGSGDAAIQGFATEISTNVGTTIHFKVNTPATAYHIDV